MKPVHTLLRLARNRSGATAIEYSLIAGLICIVIVSGVMLLGQNTNNAFVEVNEGVWGP